MTKLFTLHVFSTFILSELVIKNFIKLQYLFTNYKSSQNTHKNKIGLVLSHSLSRKTSDIVISDLHLYLLISSPVFT